LLIKTIRRTLPLPFYRYLQRKSIGKIQSADLHEQSFDEPDSRPLIWPLSCFIARSLRPFRLTPLRARC